jgi:3-deoxy-7-phosphoheptulonate synthase
MTPVAPVHNRRIASVHPLVAPGVLRSDVPLSDRARAVVVAGRSAVGRIIHGEDDRLVVIVGPCSIHDPVAAIDYARRLAKAGADHADDLVVVMRAYFEKPRTTLGWKGLINDPGLDGSFRVNDGLRSARHLLVEILDHGLPVGCEFLDPITPQYLADAVSWGAIGARTAQSQIHRQLASGLSMPIGFKNSTDGDPQPAIDATAAAAVSHVFAGIDDDGQPAVFATTGNPDGHVVLRGGHRGPNYDVATVTHVRARLAGLGLASRVIIDASHDNSGKDYRQQPAVAQHLAARISAPDRAIAGVMLESFLTAGRQDFTLGATDDLVYGMSVTDSCIDWDTTSAVLERLADASAARRRLST